ncbi:MAG: chemotaxis protein CheC [Coriobacteriia bacterium]|nr:chemotaxis protein CheC [Coriobacteriia bacterium]
MNPDQLSALQIDALREVGSIGAGHAATALSQMLGKAVYIDVPRIALIPVTEVPNVLGGPERLVGVVHSRLLGDIEGSVVFIAAREELLGLVDMMRSREPGTTKSLHGDEEALAVHTASILISAYVAAIGRMADISLIPAPPSFAFDMLGAILQVVIAEVGMKVDTALLILTRFTEVEQSIEAGLFYLPDPDSLEILLGRLGII